MRHTAGPWKIGKSNRICAVDDSPVAQALSWPHPMDVNGNAALIAASPDMLAALRAARVFAENELDVRERSYSPSEDEPYLKEAREVVDLLRRTIAKAEGGAA